jgi:hypothetical protein
MLGLTKEILNKALHQTAILQWLKEKIKNE